MKNFIYSINVWSEEDVVAGDGGLSSPLFFKIILNPDSNIAINRIKENSFPPTNVTLYSPLPPSSSLLLPTFSISLSTSSFQFLFLFFSNLNVSEFLVSFIKTVTKGRRVEGGRLCFYCVRRSAEESCESFFFSTNETKD